MPLPAGLEIVNSIALELDGGMQRGCCILKKPDDSEWWSTDYFCGPGQDPMAYSAVFGPFPNEAGARNEMEGSVLVEMDANGTPGTSTWLVYP